MKKFTSPQTLYISVSGWSLSKECMKAFIPAPLYSLECLYLKACDLDTRLLSYISTVRGNLKELRMDFAEISPVSVRDIFPANPFKLFISVITLVMMWNRLVSKS